MRILRSPCDAKQRSEPNRGEVWRLCHTGVGTATPLTNWNSVASRECTRSAHMDLALCLVH
eukprot:scaffold12602_cov93-Skeletonema_marinoi.AAC.1